MDASELSVVAARYREACAVRDAALVALRDSIRAAVSGGMSKNEAIRVSGLARQTVYNFTR